LPQGGSWEFAGYAFGPAAFTDAGTSFSNILKFSTNIAASFFACSSYFAASGQVLRGSTKLSGTACTLFGTSMLKIGCYTYSTLSSCPVSAAVIIARVCAIFMRVPTPYGPPVQPVLTSHTRALCFAIFSPSIFA
jgi:hypothetical protein